MLALLQTAPPLLHRLHLYLTSPTSPRSCSSHFINRYNIFKSSVVDDLSQLKLILFLIVLHSSNSIFSRWDSKMENPFLILFQIYHNVVRSGFSVSFFFLLSYLILTQLWFFHCSSYFKYLFNIFLRILCRYKMSVLVV